MNKIELLGRLTDDVKLSKSKNDTSYTKFTIAVQRKSNKEITDFINCIAFGKIAEAIEKYTEKGNRIMVVGELNIDSYTNKDNIKVTIYNVIVNDFYFVDFKKELTK